MGNYLRFDENDDGTTTIEINIEGIIDKQQMFVPGTIMQLVSDMIPAINPDNVGPLHHQMVEIPNFVDGAE